MEEARLGEMKLGLLEFAVFRDAHAPAATRGVPTLRGQVPVASVAKGS